MKIYLIRHGETDWNHIHRFQGRENVPLNAAGILQARNCGKTLQGLSIEAVYTSPLMRAGRTGAEIGARIGLLPEQVQPMEELIERDLGPFSGQLVKDKKEYFALAAGDGVPGMEPFKAVLKRMQQALVLMAHTGKQAVAAVSHGAAINVILAGLTNNEIGTGKTRLYNGAINVIEGSETEGFHVVHCNLPPDDPKTTQLLGYDRLEKSLMDIIREQQAKLGFRKESIGLYYPLSTLNHFFRTEEKEPEMLKRLMNLPPYLTDKLGQIMVSAKDGQFCFHIPEQGSQYVHENKTGDDFIQKLVNLVGNHCTMQEIRQLFQQYSAHVEYSTIDNGEFDYMLRFLDRPEDPYYYCFREEGCHIIYHRFLPEDYEDFQF